MTLNENEETQISSDTGTVPTPPTDTPLSVMHSQWPSLDGTVWWLCPMTQGLSQHRPLTHLCQLCIVSGLPWTGLFGDNVQWHSDCLNAAQWFTKEGIVFYVYAHQGRDYFVTMSSERDWPTDQWFTTENTVTVTRYCFVTMLAKEKIVCDYVQWQELPQHCPIPHQGRYHYCFKVLFCDYTHQGRDCFVTIPIKEGTVLWLCSPRKGLFCDYAHQGRGTCLWLCSPRKGLFCDYAHQGRHCFVTMPIKEEGLFCDYAQWQGLLQHRPVTHQEGTILWLYPVIGTVPIRPVTHQERDCFVTMLTNEGRDCFVTVSRDRDCSNTAQWLTKEGTVLWLHMLIKERTVSWLCPHQERYGFVTMSSDRDCPNTAQWLTVVETDCAGTQRLLLGVEDVACDGHPDAGVGHVVDG